MGVRDRRVLHAIELVPRPCFVPIEGRSRSWNNAPVPIGEGQTISQPYTVAAMVELAAIAEGANVLEVGAGSGYAAAVMAVLAGPRGVVTAVEIRRALSERARENLDAARAVVDESQQIPGGWNGAAAQIVVVHGDGKEGYAGAAPFDAIICSAQARSVPPRLFEQLGDRGVLVAPVYGGGTATMTTFRRAGDSFLETHHGLYSFVPLV